ncbi:MAG: nucleotidyltransferase family protein [Opitutaceae bacterium]|nr:nucleotidyltransferase family protein [Opitutaceae bacterium]
MAEPSPFSYGLVVLAAGASRRMGRPKPLLPIGGVPLLRYVVANLLEGPVAPVVVVLGAQVEVIAPVLDGLPVHRVVNAGWAEGMGSSLRAGVAAALELAPQLSGLMVVLGDQPGLTAAHLRRLEEARRRTGRAVIASQSGGVAMPPVLFAAEYFPRLLTLRGETGARALLQAAGEELVVVPASELVDLDTIDDYADFTRRVALVGGNPCGT